MVRPRAAPNDRPATGGSIIFRQRARQSAEAFAVRKCGYSAQPELSTLPKSGTFYFALTRPDQIDRHAVLPKSATLKVRLRASKPPGPAGSSFLREDKPVWTSDQET